ncbi:MAG: cation diffusion facilitator family transporter [Firmicutes bacterium]|nr:cation transporter [Alicyclobacillaceae bacterium]MCL6496615.1 cation diffusion facilitator family transporter [Bacillota bacterium]
MPEPGQELRFSERSAWWGVVGNLALTAIKIGVGVVGHSQALVADGVHSAADLAASAAVAVGLRISQQPPDEGHNYGHAKAEAVAQKVVAVLLILAGFELGTRGLAAFAHPVPEVPSALALAVAAAVMVLKEGMYRSQRAVARRTGSHALMASALDNRMDVISSGLATAGILASRLGVPHADALGAVGVAGLVVWLGVQLFGQAANDLMDRAAGPETVAAIRAAAQGVEGVLGISEVRTRMAGAMVLVDIAIVVDRKSSLLDAHAIAHAVEEAILALPRMQSVMVHVDPAPDGVSPQGGPGMRSEP